MTRSMLIVDDEETIRWALRELFMQDGWAVHVAADGDEAARKVDRHGYDFMITDLKMPGASGVEVIRRARQSNPEMGVLVLTGYASLESAVQALRLRAWDYVTKPCSANDLKERVDEFVARRGPAPSPGGLPDDRAADLLHGGTELLTLPSVRPQQNVGEALDRLGKVLRHLGLSSDRAEQVTQACLELLALLPDGVEGRLRAALLDGCLGVAIGLPGVNGRLTEEFLADLGSRFQLSASLCRGQDGPHAVVSGGV